MAMALPYLLTSITALLLLHASLSASAQPIHHEINQINVKISHLESVLEETNKRLKESDVYMEECDKRMSELLDQIHHLQSTLSTMKADPLLVERRNKALEEEVQLLWHTLRRNNFDLHILKSKAQETEERLEEVTSKVEKEFQANDDQKGKQWFELKLT